MALLLGLSARAQESSDLRPTVHGAYWLSLGVEWKPLRKKDGAITERHFNKNFSVTGELGLRAAADPFAYQQTYLSASARYRVNDFWRVGAEYRYSFREQPGSNSGRIDLQSWLRWKNDRIRLDHRFQYERDFIVVTKVRSSLRNRFSVEYNIPKWKFDPQASVEIFTGLHYTGVRNIGVRYELGTEFAPGKNKDRTLGVAVRYDREVNTARPENNWIFVLSYALDIKKK